MCRSRRELSNEYLLAKIGVDTAENEPLEVWGKIQFTIQPARGGTSMFGKKYLISVACFARPAARAAQGRGRSWGTLATFSRISQIINYHFEKSELLQFFGGLVLGCIETKFCKKICVPRKCAFGGSKKTERRLQNSLTDQCHTSSFLPQIEQLWKIRF